MTNKEYIDNALRTESIDGAVDRLSKSMCYNSLDTANTTLDFVASTLDGLKKHIFYGKDFADFNIQTQLDGLETYVNIPNQKIRLLHAALGFVTESVEFLQPVLESIYQGKELDIVNLKEELGDLLWYQAIAIDALNTSFEVEMDRNIRKLSARYPHKFDADKAINRDLDNEYKVLQGEIK